MFAHLLCSFEKGFHVAQDGLELVARDDLTPLIFLFSLLNANNTGQVPPPQAFRVLLAYRKSSGLSEAIQDLVVSAGKGTCHTGLARTDFQFDLHRNPSTGVS